MTSIIVDDEVQSHEVLRSLLARHHPDVAIQASGYTVQEGYDLVLRHRPELVFLDIELPDGLGFDLLKKLSKPDFWVIFITAYDHYAKTAIRFGALDFLTKPISPEDLAGALGIAREKQREKIVTQQQLDILWETFRNLQERKLPTLLGIHTSQGIVYRQVQEIVRLEAQQNYTEFSFAQDQKKMLASVNLGEYADQFEPYREFMRVHRSHLVNLAFVDKYVRSEGGYLVMKDGKEISVSKTYRDEVLERLERL